MRKDLGAKPYLFPQPVMIIGTYDENGKANAMNAAWGGIVGRNEIIIDLSNHKTTENLLEMTEELAKKFENGDSRVIKLSRLRYVKDSFDKGPIVLTTSYMPVFHNHA